MMNKRSSKGFTFIEVLIALVIIAIALVAATTASSTATGSTSHLRDKVFAHWVAENRINELRINNAFPDIGSEESDTVELGKSSWLWEQVVSKNGQDDQNFRRITINVYKGEDKGNSQKPLTFLTTVLVNPTFIDN